MGIVLHAEWLVVPAPVSLVTDRWRCQCESDSHPDGTSPSTSQREQDLFQRPPGSLRSPTLWLRVSRMHAVRAHDTVTLGSRFLPVTASLAGTILSSALRSGIARLEAESWSLAVRGRVNKVLDGASRWRALEQVLLSIRATVVSTLRGGRRFACSTLSVSGDAPGRAIPRTSERTLALSAREHASKREAAREQCEAREHRPPEPKPGVRQGARAASRSRCRSAVVHLPSLLPSE